MIAKIDRTPFIGPSLLRASPIFTPALLPTKSVAPVCVLNWWQQLSQHICQPTPTPSLPTPPCSLVPQVWEGGGVRRYCQRHIQRAGVGKVRQCQCLVSRPPASYDSACSRCLKRRGHRISFSAGDTAYVQHRVLKHKGHDIVCSAQWTPDCLQHSLPSTCLTAAGACIVCSKGAQMTPTHPPAAVPAAAVDNITRTTIIASLLMTCQSACCCYCGGCCGIDTTLPS